MLSNLKWGTHAENSADSILHKVQPQGSLHGNAKLTEEIIPIIRARRRDGLSWSKIAAEFCVSQSAIRRICSGAGWKHVA